MDMKTKHNCMWINALFSSVHHAIHLISLMLQVTATADPTEMLGEVDDLNVSMSKEEHELASH